MFGIQYRISFKWSNPHFVVETAEESPDSGSLGIRGSEFEWAERGLKTKALEIRGPGEMEGTKQSGALNFKLASIVHDKTMLEAARAAVEKIIQTDPELESAENIPLKNFLQQQKGKTLWSKIA